MNAQSVLDSMEEEHSTIDPLLAAVDHAFAHPEDGRLGDVTDALTSDILNHLTHEERDALPLIGVALTASEWRSAGFAMARKNGLSAGGEMFAWLNDGADQDRAAAVLKTLPPRPAWSTARSGARATPERSAGSRCDIDRHRARSMSHRPHELRRGRRHSSRSA